MKWVLWLAVLICVVQCSTISRDELEDFSNFLLETSSLDLHVKKGAEPDGSFDEDEVVSDNAWEESGKFEGDLILNDRQRRLIVETVEGLSRNGLKDTTKRWPNNEVTYFIQNEHFTSGQVQAIQDGIDDLARASCVKFRPYRKGDPDAVVIQGSRRGCFSQVGYQGGYQVLNLSGRHPVGRGCFRHGTVVHELLHTLGFYHMQSSPDRDDYINVVWANIVQPARHNFRKYNSFSVSDFGVGYDYDSVLHYSRRAFSANGQDTLVPKTRGAAIGQRVGLSDKDTQKLNKMYCDADNDAVQADVNTTQKPKNKKKKPKNQPFQGEGIGYHQGKTVVIKLPAAETYKLSNVPSTNVFDFSTTPQVVSTPEAEGYRFGKEIIYRYKPVMNPETVKDYQSKVKPIFSKNTQKHLNAIDEKEDKTRLSTKNSNDSSEMKPEYVPIDVHDKDLNDAFHKLTMIVKQNVYPKNDDYVHKINKDYSKFFTPMAPKKTDSFLDYLDEKFKQSISYIPLTSTSPIQSKQFENSQLEDRMDTSYRTMLPTKKPYSSYEQTETPRYATLEYLKNRDDYRNLYSPKIPEDDKHSDHNLRIEDYKYEQDIKIDPHDKGFYTDYVQEETKGRLKDTSKIENNNNKLKDTLTENPSGKQTDLTNKQIENIMDSSYRTISPTTMPYNVYEQTETPNYATLEYLKGRHDINSAYTPKLSDEENRKEHYTIGDELSSTNDDWFQKDTHKHYPAKYTDTQKHDKNDDYDEDDDENSTERFKKAQTNKTGYHDRDYYTEYEKESNGREADESQQYNDDQNGQQSPKNRQSKHNEEDDVQSYNTDYDIDGSSHLKGAPHDDDDDDNIGNSKELPTKYSPLKYKAAKYEHDYFTDYEKENDRIAPDENSKLPPKKGQAHKLYGHPVPVTKDWYEASYSIPGISSEDENSRSHEDHR